MCLRSHSRDCAEQNHWPELRMCPTTTQLGVLLWKRMFFTPSSYLRPLIGRERSREFFDDVAYANESCDHFLALWLAKSKICCALIGYRLKEPCILLKWTHRSQKNPGRSAILLFAGHSRFCLYIGWRLFFICWENPNRVGILLFADHPRFCLYMG